MGKWFKDFEALVWAATIAVGSMVFIFQAFATKEYVDTKHEGVMEVLKEIREDVREIRAHQMDRHNGP